MKNKTRRNKVKSQANARLQSFIDELAVFMFIVILTKTEVGGPPLLRHPSSCFVQSRGE